MVVIRRIRKGKKSNGYSFIHDMLKLKRKMKGYKKGTY